LSLLLDLRATKVEEASDVSTNRTDVRCVTVPAAVIVVFG